MNDAAAAKRRIRALRSNAIKARRMPIMARSIGPLNRQSQIMLSQIFTAAIETVIARECHFCRRKIGKSRAGESCPTAKSTLESWLRRRSLVGFDRLSDYRRRLRRRFSRWIHNVLLVRVRGRALRPFLQSLARTKPAWSNVAA